MRNCQKILPFVFSNNYHVLFVKEKNLVNPVNFSMMSDGAKRVFMILTKIIVSSVSNISLITIEEPENSVRSRTFSIIYSDYQSAVRWLQSYHYKSFAIYYQLFKPFLDSCWYE